MTWSFINQLTSATKEARILERRKFSLFPQDIVIFTALVSGNPYQRVFGLRQGLLDGTLVPETQFLFKEIPEVIKDLCPTFLLPGLNTRSSEVAFSGSDRDFMSSWRTLNLITKSSGVFRFFLGSAFVFRFFCGLFLKTRRLSLLRASLYNQQRKRFYVWHPLELGRVLALDSLRKHTLGTLVFNCYSLFVRIFVFFTVNWLFYFFRFLVKLAI
jgi:hypothetical protein